MYTYIYIILIILIFFYLDYVYKNFFLDKIGLIVLVIISSLRYNTGTDYLEYKKIFDSLKIGNKYKDYEYLEKGYIYLNKLIINLGLNFHILLGVITLFYIALIYKTLLRYEKKYLFFSIFLWITSFNLFFFSLSIIRQSIVIAIFFYSTYFVIERKFFKYICFLIGGFFFHKGIILMLPCYFINKIGKKSIIIGNMILVLIFFIRNEIIQTIDYFASTYNFTKYAGFLINVNANIAKIVFIYVIMYIFVIYLLFKEKDKQRKIFFNYILIYFYLRILMGIGFHSLFYRIIPFFEIYYIIFIPEILKKIKKSRYIKKIIIIIIISIQCIFFTYEYKSWIIASPFHKKMNEKFKIIKLL